MKVFYLSFLMLILCHTSKAQDVIVRNNGDHVKCIIIKQDSSNVYFKLVDRDLLETCLPMEKVRHIYYESEVQNITNMPDSISYKKESYGYSYYHLVSPIKRRDISSLVKLNPGAKEDCRIYKNNIIAAHVFGLAGGFMIGYQAGNYFEGREPSWWMVGIGAGLAVISIPLNFKATKHLHKAIDIYNDGLNHSSNKEIKMSFGMCHSGFGFKVVY